MSTVILAVEDNAVTSAAIGREFTACGFEVHLALSAEEAFLKLENGLKCDLIILDFHLPVEQGPEFYRRLGMHPKYKNLTVIPFTSQIESTSNVSNNLLTEYATNIQADPEDRTRQTMVSKGFSDEVGKLPAGLYVEVSKWFRHSGKQPPEKFTTRMREALGTGNN